MEKVNGGKPVFQVEDELSALVRLYGRERVLVIWNECVYKPTKIKFKIPLITGTKNDLK